MTLRCPTYDQGSRLRGHQPKPFQSLRNVDASSSLPESSWRVESVLSGLHRAPGFRSQPDPSLFVGDPISFDHTKVQAAIVDLDGTMVDTVGDFEQALARTLAEFGLPPVDRAFITRTVGRGSMNLLRETLAHAGGAPGLLDDAWAHYQRHYADVNGTHADVYPGVAEGLAAMRARGWQLACVTNKPRAFAVALLEAKGLLPFFAQVFGGDSFERHKPDPLPLLKTCEALGTHPAQTLMVGDSRNDAEAARAAGCPVVLVSYGYNHGEPVADARPDRVIAGLDVLA
jgi:phosphoglycolate phosphatase